MTISPDADFSAWYVAAYPRVRRTLTLAVGDAELADEATAEAFARALVRWQQVQGMAAPHAWVHRVGLNLVRSALRRRRLERRWLARQRVQDVPAPPEPDGPLWQAVAALPERMRTAVALRYVADLTEQQVADVMGITRGAVASSLSAARARLAQQLAPSERTLP
ncbi:RNA polymerase sigma factor [Kineosporia sp. A_224]|uniref:RNA polymerase sigma factor n=1 Tax=Kineosporia sp. A_224 TaxID=1962180 RepID=UPI000B4A8B13|nr:sigma-70 family RNA polymerase sigma factor [Kineosporia sp. A_224]